MTREDKASAEASALLLFAVSKLKAIGCTDLGVSMIVMSAAKQILGQYSNEEFKQMGDKPVFDPETTKEVALLMAKINKTKDT